MKESDLVVEHSYFGSAVGDWRSRALGDDEPRHVEWGDGTGDIHLNDRIFLAHVPEAVWKYRMGGYPILKKWLGYRDSRRRNGGGLTLDELVHFRTVIQRIAALLTLRTALDVAYERAGGQAWLIDDVVGKASSGTAASC